ncbi:excalibur calcium-binding domain-containing protein [Xanthomonas sp. 1678]|uniref:excalibur calcium-binding domain-containing protein n=1 Tax=Xanthomonas sp. 1678 TaxID=3158788 RepID=UPI0028640DC2|nr:cold shock CspA family protein [Xanthomonas translucens]
MRTHGTLIKWNEERGFGFVRSAHGDTEIFVHIASFPRDGVRPRLGELISFDLEHDAEGRPRAVRVMRPGHAAARRGRPAAAGRRRRGALGSGLAVLALLGIGVYAYSLIAPRFAAAPVPDMTAPVAPATQAAAEPRFQCDGRTRCTQMTSCEEATYFLQHCPGAKMDGNHDGVPCEQQWCH